MRTTEERSFKIRPPRRPGEGTLLIACILVALPCFAIAVHADEDTGTADILIISPEALLGPAMRMKAELESTGFEVDMSTEELSKDDLERAKKAGRASGAQAVVLLPSTADGIDVLLGLDNEEGDPPRSLSMKSPLELEHDSEFWLSAVELIRASMLKVELPESPVEPPEPSSPSAEPDGKPPEEPATPSTEEKEDDYRWSLDLGGGIVAASFDSPPVGSVLISAAGLLSNHLGLFATGYIPVSTSTKTTREGELKHRTGLIGGGLQALPFGKKNRFFVPRVDLGFAALFHSVSGRADTGFEDREQRVVAGAPFLRVFAGLRLSNRVLLGAEIALGYSLAKTVLRSGGKEALQLGRPFLCAALSLRFSLL